MTRYEYDVVFATSGGDIEGVLDDKSSGGWRYVEAIPFGETHTTRALIFERERRETFEPKEAIPTVRPDDEMFGEPAHIVYGTLLAHETTGNLPTGPDDLESHHPFKSWSVEKIRECFDTLEDADAITLNDDGEVIKTSGFGGFL